MEFKGIINIQNSGSITEGHDQILKYWKKNWMSFGRDIHLHTKCRII